MWFTLELSFAISQASAAHQVTILRLAVPLLSNAIVDTVVMAPLRGITSKVATAQPQASAPQLEASLRHALPLSTNIMVGCGKGIITRVLIGWHSLWDCVSSSDNLLQNLVFERPLQSLHEHIIVCSGGQSDQGSCGGCAWQAYLEHLLICVCDWIAGDQVGIALALRLPGDGGLSLSLLRDSCLVIKRGADGHIQLHNGHPAALCIREGHKD